MKLDEKLWLWDLKKHEIDLFQVLFDEIREKPFYPGVFNLKTRCAVEIAVIPYRFVLLRVVNDESDHGTRIRVSTIIALIIITPLKYNNNKL